MGDEVASHMGYMNYGADIFYYNHCNFSVLKMEVTYCMLGGIEHSWL